MLRTSAQRVGVSFNSQPPASASACSCALDTAQQLWCWGADDSGQLGTVAQDPNLIGDPGWTAIAVLLGSNRSGQIGNASDVDRYQPTQIGAANEWLEIAANGDHTCAVKVDHTLVRVAKIWQKRRPPKPDP